MIILFLCVKIQLLTQRVLYISPYFPPHRAVGTKRAIAFAQGIHEVNGWEVIVLASKSLNGDDDQQLDNHIPEGVRINYGFVGIFRPFIKWFAGGDKKKKPIKSSKKIEPPRVLKPSKQKGLLNPFDQYLWDTGSAVRNGSKLIKKYRPDVIWVNADPWSGFLVGDKLSRKFNIPWVGDMRDPLTAFRKKFEMKPALTKRLLYHYEKKFVTSATKVVLNTEAASEEYKKIYSSEDENKFTFIRNAFNENILEEQKPMEGREVFTFGYYGGFRYFVPSTYILKGFARFIKKCELNPSQVRFEVRGGVYSDFWIQLKEFQLEDYVSVEKEVNSNQAISLLRSWDVLILGVINEVQLMIPSKFYDYLFARKPILAVSDNRELNKLIDETKSGSWVSTDKIEKIAEAFEFFYATGKTDLLKNEALIKPFGLENQAGKFRQVLKNVLQR